MIARMGIAQRFMLTVGFGIAVLITAVVITIVRFERADTETTLHEMSVSEISSLQSLILNVMAMRPEDGDNIGIRVFNNWFNSRNAHYKGQVWSSWGEKVARHMAEVEPDRAPKAPRDDIDREVLQTAKPIGRMVDGAYRYSMPIILGVTEGADQEVCHSCHGAGMSMQDGEVIAVLSTSLSAAEAMTKLNTIIAALIGGGLVAGAIALLGLRFILRKFIAKPIESMTETMVILAEGNVDVAVPAIARHDEVGRMARALQVFKDNAIRQRRMESEAAGEAAAKAARMTQLEELIRRFDVS
ncbi:MAG: HAMP domain-containing protein, partial [Magnetospirillum sp.]|nr:HAMP domain-containing protein [Magnetospirillum sp.]